MFSSRFKVLFDGKRAIGVEYTQNNDVRTVGARKEVILAAGTIGSAKLLLLSGVGPRKHLSDVKVFSLIYFYPRS